MKYPWISPGLPFWKNHTAGLRNALFVSSQCAHARLSAAIFSFYIMDNNENVFFVDITLTTVQQG
jgi:hypothetical protein